MSEISLPALFEAEQKSPNSQPIKEIDAALKACKFGLFHIKLLVITFVGMTAGGLVSNSTSYLLPSAECDLEMGLVHKGILNASPYLGMILSSVVAGFLTDTFGRKIFVLVGFGGIFTFTLVAATSQTFEVLVFAKFFEGLLFATSLSALLTLTSEFCHSGIRDRILLLQSSYLSVAQIVIPAMSWGILINDWNVSLFDGRIVLKTWNFYLYAVSLWSLASFLLYWLLIPESPKFLVTQNNFDAAREILYKMYRENTWKKIETYPFYNIWKEKQEDNQKPSLHSLPEHEAKNNVSHQLVIALHNIKPMFMRPLGGYLFLLCFLNFKMMCLSNIIRLWFPQLSTIVEHYKTNDDQDLCQMLDTYTFDLKMLNLNKTDDVCIPAKSGAETYINSIILGAACLLPYFMTGILVNKVGKKLLLILLGGICVGAVFGIRWANTKPIIVGLFATALAITQITMGLNQAITMETFHTTQRTLAVSILLLAGRLGTLVGNVMFPILLDMACVIPFYTMTAMMAMVTVSSFLLPTKKN